MESELLVELSQHQKLLKQLIDQPEEFKSLAPKLLSSIQEAISMAKGTYWSMADSGVTRVTNAGESPHSETSGLTLKDRQHPMPRKRKALRNFTRQVKLSSMEGYDRPMEDGYSWRKYGQKDIHEAKYPRGYYRCTHRNTQACLAIKQVQRSDENPSLFDVTYCGNHTCNQKPQQESSERKQSLCQFQQEQKQHVLDFGTELGVKTEGIDTKCNEKGSVACESFSFSYPPMNCFEGSFSSDLISPVTSESNYSLSSLFEVKNNGETPTLDVGNFDFIEFLDASGSTNSSMIDMDFMLDPIKQDLSTFYSEDL